MRIQEKFFPNEETRIFVICVQFGKSFFGRRSLFHALAYYSPKSQMVGFLAESKHAKRGPGSQGELLGILDTGLAVKWEGVGLIYFLKRQPSGGNRGGYRRLKSYQEIT
ncbi:MAG TPA: hypothetical protein QF772_04835 [Nitrospinaceae bacterium]|nr:hypothetical protein [Nitrospinaceae bacterium]